MTGITSATLETERVIPFPGVRAALDGADTRTVKRLCERHGVPVRYLNAWRLVLTERDDALLLRWMLRTARPPLQHVLQLDLQAKGGNRA